MDIGQAIIYKNKKNRNLIIHCISHTNGLGIATEPIIKLDASSPIEEIAKQVIYVMSCSKSNLQSPTDWKAHLQEFLKLVGVKKHSDLYKNAISVGALTMNETIKFTPMVNKGSGGFVNVPNGQIVLPAKSSLEEISKALQEAFNRCK